MRKFAELCITATLLAAPAFAQAPGVSLSTAPKTAAANANEQQLRGESESLKFSLGVVDRFSIRRGAERSLLPVAPIETDQLALSWRPGGKWGITLDLTSRPENELLLPKEELTAGAFYQVTPRFRFGGGLTLNGDTLRDAARGWEDKDGEAGVQIRSEFSF